MLLRSASSPLLNYAYPARVPAAELLGAGHLAVVPVSPAGRKGVLCRALSEGDLLAQWADGHGRTPTPLSATSSSAASALFEEDEEAEYEDVAVPLRRLLTSTGLDAAARVESSSAGGGLALLEGPRRRRRALPAAHRGHAGQLAAARQLRPVPQGRGGGLGAGAGVLRARHRRQPRRRRRARALRGDRLGDQPRRRARRRLLQPRRAGGPRRLQYFGILRRVPVGRRGGRSRRCRSACAVLWGCSASCRHSSLLGEEPISFHRLQNNGTASHQEPRSLSDEPPPWPAWLAGASKLNPTTCKMNLERAVRF